MSGIHILIAFIKAAGLVAATITFHFILDLPRFKEGHKTDNMSATVFTTDTLPKDKRLMATIGNGYVATTVYSDTIHVSGVYNGRRRQPSHRARVPSTAAIKWSLKTPDTVKTTYFLDVAKGVFVERSEGTGFQIEESVFAHRRQQHLLVVQIKVLNSRSEPMEINLLRNQGKKSSDIKFREVPQSEIPADSSGVTEAMFGEINTTEEENSEKVGVAVVWTAVPKSVVVEARANRTFHFITAIVTSLNTVDYLKSAFSYHKEGTMNVDSLLQDHSEGWEDLWRLSSIVIEGDLKLAQAVYGSLYYILR